MTRREPVVIAGRYELDPVHIGKGGMGEVWGATDTRLRRRVAVKFLRFADDEELTRRFVRESRLTARISHPGVPVLHDAAMADAGPFEGRLYLVMELIDGVALDDLVAEHEPFPVGWAASIAAQICAVLAYAHGASLVHRDLKPGNVMVDRDGAVKVLDFGLAVALDDRSRLTSTGRMLGTLAYMAPEQFAGRPGPSADLYSLGCVLFQMLTGRAPFAASDNVSFMHAHVYGEPEPVGTLRAGVPAEIDALVRGLLEKKPEARPASAEEVYDALLPHVHQQELPGAVRGGRGPARMYAGVVGRDLAARPAPTATVRAARPPAPPLPATDPGQDEPSSFSLGDVARARRSAERLARASRFGEAVRMLDGVAADAAAALGAEHPEAFAVRADLADIRFKAGDYAAAASAYRALAAGTADPGLALEYRLREANGHALAGDVGRALDQLRAVLDEQTSLHGADDPRVLDLRRQTALLLHGAGRTTLAVRDLRELAGDLERVKGPGDPMLRSVRETIQRLGG